MPPQIKTKVDNFFKPYKKQHYDKGYILIYAGHEPPGVFQLLSGQVREYDITEQGDEVVVNVFKPPAFFPMSWAINNTANQYFFEAASPIAVRRAPADESVEFLKTNPDVMFNLLSRLYSGTDGLLRRMAHLMGGNAESRLIFELVIQCQRFGKLQPDGSYFIKLSESELAKRAGLSRETVSRQLTKVSKRHSVSISRDGFMIKDLAALENTLGSNL